MLLRCNMALEDAVVLAAYTEITRFDYEDARYKRTARVQIMSRYMFPSAGSIGGAITGSRIGKSIHPWPHVAPQDGPSLAPQPRRDGAQFGAYVV